MKHAYIAAPIFTENQLRVVSTIGRMLNLQGFEYFSPYEESRSIWNGRAPRDCTAAERKRVIQGNVRGLVGADVLVAWVGGSPKTDTGVVFEMGYFYALTEYEHDDRRRFTLAYVHPLDPQQHMNLMLAETVDAVAYGHAQLSHALELLRHDKPNECRIDFHPSKLILHEKEPIA